MFASIALSEYRLTVRRRTGKAEAYSWHKVSAEFKHGRPGWCNRQDTF